MNQNYASIRQAFGRTLVGLAKTNKNIYVVNADLKSSLFLGDFATKFPLRFIECGVAEANAAGIAAGLAKSGKTVFLTSFACFSPAINWAVIKQSICLSSLNVKIVGSHAGLMSGDLGGTHQMLEDIAITRCLPNLEVFAPADALETESMVKTLSLSHSPAYLRLVRPESPVFTKPAPFTIGKSSILQKGSGVTVCGYGPILRQLFDISRYSLEIINCSSIKPLDTQIILKSVKKTKKMLVIEDHQKIGGLGEAIAHLLLSKNIKAKFVHLGVDDQFGQSALNYLELWDHYHLNRQAVTKSLEKLFKKI